jgi:membrane fusion protein (multidrug efflux system)
MEQDKNEITEENQTNNKTHKKGVKRTITAIVLILIIAVSAFIIEYSSHFQSTDDAYVENHTVQVAPKVSGQIIKVLIKDNQQIKTGELIAIIDDADYKVRYEKSKSLYEKAIAAQRVAQANYNASQIEIKNAKADLERYQKLYNTGAVSKQQLDMAQTKYESTQARLINADENVMNGNNKVADADIKALKADMDKAALELSYTKIYAPQNGTISNRTVEKGAYVGVGTPLCVIVPHDVWIVANFKESQVGKMHKGQVVDIKIDAYPKKKFKGKIDSIQRASGAKSSLFPPENAVGSFVKIVQRIPVKIVFDEKIDFNKYNIVPGMSVVPNVHLTE